MKVVIVHPQVPIYGGAEVVITRLIKGLKEKRVEAKLLTVSLPRGMEKDLNPEDVILVKKRQNPFPPVWSIDVTEQWALNNWLRKNSKEFDVINVHNYPAQFSVIGIKKPIVWTCNEPVLHLFYDSPEIRKNKLVMRLLMLSEKAVVRMLVDKAVVADSHNFGRFKRIYGFEPVIIPYGIDFEFFSSGCKERALSKFHIQPDDFVILHVGMFTPLKNQKRSVEAVKHLIEKIPNLKLFLVGHMDNVYYPEVKKMVEECGLSKRVLFINHVTREELRDLYKASNVLLHPVRPQGGWLAPFEALCAQTPVVVSEELTAAEIIRREGIGVVTDNYEEAIFEIYKSPDKYKIIAEKGAEFVRKNLNWERYCEQMLEVYGQAMEVKK